MKTDPHLEWCMRLVQHCREHNCSCEHQEEIVGLMDELEIVERVTGTTFEEAARVAAVKKSLSDRERLRQAAVKALKKRLAQNREKETR